MASTVASTEEPSTNTTVLTITSSKAGSVYAAMYLSGVNLPNAVSPSETLPSASITTGQTVRKPTIRTRDHVSLARARSMCGSSGGNEQAVGRIQAKADGSAHGQVGIRVDLCKQQVIAHADLGFVSFAHEYPGLDPTVDHILPARLAGAHAYEFRSDT